MLAENVNQIDLNENSSTSDSAGYDSGIYTKYNPVIIGLTHKGKTFDKIYNVIKYSVALGILIFAILGLYFASLWQSTVIDGEAILGWMMKPDVGLVNDLGVITGLGIGGDALAYFSSENQLMLNELAATAYVNSNELSIGLMSLQQMNLGYNAGMNDSLIVISILAIITAIPTLVFKNKTVWSVGMISLSFVWLLIVIILFGLGLTASNEILNPIKDIRDNFSQMNALLASGDTPENINPLVNALVEDTVKIANNLSNLIKNTIIK